MNFEHTRHSGMERPVSPYWCRLQFRGKGLRWRSNAPEKASASGGQLIEKRKQHLVHFAIIMRAEFFRRFDKTEFTRTAEVILRMLNQQLYHLRRQLHMALETVNPFAVLHDLAGTALAVSQNLSLRRQPGMSLCQ